MYNIKILMKININENIFKFSSELGCARYRALFDYLAESTITKLITEHICAPTFTAALFTIVTT